MSAELERRLAALEARLSDEALPSLYKIGAGGKTEELPSGLSKAEVEELLALYVLLTTLEGGTLTPTLKGLTVNGEIGTEVLRVIGSEPVTLPGVINEGSSIDSPVTATELKATPTNNWTIAEAKGTWYRIAANKAVEVTGVKGGVGGRLLILTNVSTNTITFKSENAGSNESNRLKLTTPEVALEPGHTLTLIYDGVTKRWRDVALR